MKEHSGPPLVSQKESQRANAAGHIWFVSQRRLSIPLQTVVASGATCRVKPDFLCIHHAGTTHYINYYTLLKPMIGYTKTTGDILMY